MGKNTNVAFLPFFGQKGGTNDTLKKSILKYSIFDHFCPFLKNKKQVGPMTGGTVGANRLFVLTMTIDDFGLI